MAASRIRTFKDLPPGIQFALLWVVLPNLAFIGLWTVGGPVRPVSIALYLLIGFAARWLPRVVTAGVIIMAVLFDVAWFTAFMFNIPIVSLGPALGFFRHLQPAASTAYLMAAVSLTFVTAAMITLAVKFHAQLRRASLIPAVVVATVLILADLAINASATDRFGRFVTADAPFESATHQAGIDAKTIIRKRHGLLVVMVEAWGLFSDDRHRRHLMAPFRQPAIANHYAVTTGSTTYYGTTTTAEIRELCGHWGDYHTYLNGEKEACLPEQLAAHGYDTTAIHGFTGEMFERRQWYPHIGFENQFFLETLNEDGDLPQCGGVFVGICDVAIAPRIRERLLNTSRRKPQFLYWLTLNTHFPVPTETVTEHFDCEGESPPFSHHMTCQMADLWYQLFTRIAAIAKDPRLPPTDILIVGDHNPPFWQRRAASLFVPGRVPWIVLKSQPTDTESKRRLTAK